MGSNSDHLDVMIIGGGPAGLSAALCLGRSRKKVVVIDAGAPRHAVSEGVHNFLTREGMPPSDLRRIAWEQMAAYPSVKRVTGHRLKRLTWEDERWVGEATDGTRWRARAALLATGVVDEHPSIPGYQERWGHSIHHCPFCHGWEMQDRPLAVLAAGEDPLHLSLLLKGWSRDVVVLTGGRAIADESLAALRQADIPIYTQAVTGLSGAGRSLEAIHLSDGTTLERQGLFVVAGQHQVPLVQSLSLRYNEMGYVACDAQMQTSLPMMWAAGDVTTRMQQVLESAAQGLRAGAMIAATLTLG